MLTRSDGSVSVQSRVEDGVGGMGWLLMERVGEDGHVNETRTSIQVPVGGVGSVNAVQS